ncbi:hypothetical protein BASA81_015293 [Batrachochytrium salamandrivorans]|nr:hypothetical protein BASA81_015293 [Batrachochytrium salamandrivorans]
MEQQSDAVLERFNGLRVREVKAEDSQTAALLAQFQSIAASLELDERIKLVVNMHKNGVELLKAVLSNPQGNKICFLHWWYEGIEDVNLVIPLLINHCPELASLYVYFKHHSVFDFASSLLERPSNKLKVLEMPWSAKGDSARLFAALGQSQVSVLTISIGESPEFNQGLFEYLAKDLLVRLKVRMGNRQVPSEMMMLLANCTRLAKLEMLRCEFSQPTAFTHLPKSITKLVLHDCQFIGGFDWSFLADNNVRELDFIWVRGVDGNQLGDALAVYLRAKGLDKLRFFECNFTNETLAVVGVELGRIKRLDLEESDLNDASLEQIALALLSPNSEMKELMLLYDGNTASSIKTHLVPALKHPNCNLVRLSLLTYEPEHKKAAKRVEDMFHNRRALFALLQGRQVKRRYCPLRRLPVEMFSELEDGRVGISALLASIILISKEAAWGCGCAIKKLGPSWSTNHPPNTHHLPQNGELRTVSSSQVEPFIFAFPRRLYEYSKSNRAEHSPWPLGTILNNTTSWRCFPDQAGGRQLSGEVPSIIGNMEKPAVSEEAKPKAAKGANKKACCHQEEDKGIRILRQRNKNGEQSDQGEAAFTAVTHELTTPAPPKKSKPKGGEEEEETFVPSKQQRGPQHKAPLEVEEEPVSQPKSLSDWTAEELLKEVFAWAQGEGIVGCSAPKQPVTGQLLAGEGPAPLYVLGLFFPNQEFATEDLLAHLKSKASPPRKFEPIATVVNQVLHGVKWPLRRDVCLSPPKYTVNTSHVNKATTRGVFAAPNKPDRPSMLLYRLEEGGFGSGMRLIQFNAVNDPQMCTVLLAPSGAGKTRKLFELLSTNLGYFIPYKRAGDKNDGSTALSAVSYVFGRQVTVVNEDPKPSQWLYIQLFPYQFLGTDLFKLLATELYQSCDPKTVLEYDDFRKDFYCVIDEAQVLGKDLQGKFRSTKPANEEGRRPLLSPFLEGVGKALDRLPIIAGTGLTLLEEWESVVSQTGTLQDFTFTDLPLLTYGQVLELLQRFLIQDGLEHAAQWLVGRPRWAAEFITRRITLNEDIGDYVKWVTTTSDDSPQPRTLAWCFSTCTGQAAGIRTSRRNNRKPRTKQRCKMPFCFPWVLSPFRAGRRSC